LIRDQIPARNTRRASRISGSSPKIFLAGKVITVSGADWPKISDCVFYGLTHIRATHTMNNTARVSERRITRPVTACPSGSAPFRGHPDMKFHSVAKAALVLSLLAAPCIAQAPRAARDYFNRGDSLYRKGDFEGAIADFTKAIEISSRLDDRSRANDQGREMGAASNFDKVRVLDPLAAAAYANRGLARYRLCDYDGAIADCDRAIAINPHLFDAYNNRGMALYALKDYDHAIADFDRAIAISPRLPDAYNNRGNAYMGKEDLDRAIADFDKAVALDPRLTALYFNRGFARRRIADGDGALKDFDKAIALAPNLASGYYGRGVALCDKNDLNRAINEFNRAIELDPRFALAYGNRGLALLRQGKDAEAEKDFERAVALRPELRAELESYVEQTKKWRQTNR
jgi:tetratricopeptide (TPR) repeat protein